MRRLLATISNVDILLPGMILGACLNLCVSDVAVSDLLEPATLEATREEEPPKPSTRLAQLTDTLPVISARRHMEPASL